MLGRAALAETRERRRHATQTRTRTQPSRRWLLIAAAVAIIALALAHTLLVGRRYHVGSFDDDAGYILTARAIASGTGLTTTLATGFPLVAVYPPGYAALLSPLVLIWGHALLPLRALSVLLFVAIFPLTWIYLDRRDVSKPLRLAVLLLLAMSPVLATYGTMIMAEVPFVVVFLLFLLAAGRWDKEGWADDASLITTAGLATIVAGAALVWLKEAGIGLVLGLAVWFLLRRWWRHALITTVGTALLFLPVVVARGVAGASLIGSRYSSDLSGPYTGSLVHRLTHSLPHMISTYVSKALPLSIVPTRASPLPFQGPTGALLAVVQWTVAPLLIVGFVVWVRRYRDAACVIVPVYFVETLLYPYVNERRVILVLPVVVTWYVLGAHATFAAVLQWITDAHDHKAPLRRAAAFAVPVAFGLLVIVPLVFQFPRDYLFALDQDSTRPAGSPYMALLRDLGHPQDVVETDYLWTTALYSGHRTAAGAFASPVCDLGVITRGVSQDNAGYLLSAALNKPGLVDSTCMLPAIAPQPWAVRLYRTARENASVFELVGPGTAHPLLRDVASDATLSTSATTIVEAPEVPQADGDPAGSYPTIQVEGGTATLSWTWNRPSRISQVSLGAASPTDPTGELTSFVIEARTPSGDWQSLSTMAGPVGDGTSIPYLLVPLPNPIMATAVRITASGQGTIGVHDLHVLGQP